MTRHLSFRQFSISRKILILFSANIALLLIAVIIAEFYSKRSSTIKSSAVLVEFITVNSMARQGHLAIPRQIIKYYLHYQLI